MSQATRAEMQRLLAAEFERHGWDYDLTTVPSLVDEVERAGVVDPGRLASTVPAEYLERAEATRADIADAIRAAIGGRALRPEPARQVVFKINDNRYSINLTGSQVSGSTLNTGAQVTIQGDSPKDDVLDAVATIVTAGLQGEWNVEAADDLARVVETRKDITYEEVRQRTLAAAEQTRASSGSAKLLLAQIATGTVSGVLGTGIVAALGALT